MPRSLFDETQVVQAVARIVAADTTTLKSLFGPTTPDNRVDVCYVSNSDSIDHVVTFYVTSGGVDYAIGSINIPTLTGTAALPAKEVIATLFPNGSGAWMVNNATVIKAAVSVAVTGAFQVAFYMVGGNFL